MIPSQPNGMLIEETQRFSEEYLGKPVSREDAREAIRNVVAFLDLLARWDKEGKAGRAVSESSETTGPRE